MAGDEFKAGRVRRLLKNLMPSSDAELVEKARAERKQRAGGFSSYQAKPAGERDDSIPTLEQIPGAVGSRVPDTEEDDGLLMDAPKKKAKKKTKRTPTGTDAPVDVNSEY